MGLKYSGHNYRRAWTKPRKPDTFAFTWSRHPKTYAIVEMIFRERMSLFTLLYVYLTPEDDSILAAMKMAIAFAWSDMVELLVGLLLNNSSRRRFARLATSSAWASEIFSSRVWTTSVLPAFAGISRGVRLMALIWRCCKLSSALMHGLVRGPQFPAHLWITSSRC